MVILVLAVSPLITALLNGDAIAGPGIVLPGVGLYDGLSSVEYQLLQIMPLILGRQFLTSPRDSQMLLRVLVIASLVYSLPILLEIRLSPQLHTWVYGYFPHSFEQQIRQGGFRPVVFVGHGLLVAFFVMLGVVASATLWRSRSRIGRLPPLVVTIYLSAILVLCKTIGALIYAAILLPFVRFASVKVQLRVATVLAVAALLYPSLRAAELVPTEAILSLAASFSEERADSLSVRFSNEKALLDRASQRFWFGWGRYGRNRIFDFDSGKEETISDGLWIIVMGQAGYVGFLALFGLWGLIVLRAVRAAKRIIDPVDKAQLATLAILLGVYMIDEIPNAPASPLMWLIAGAILGRADHAARVRILARSANTAFSSEIPAKVRRVGGRVAGDGRAAHRPVSQGGFGRTPPARLVQTDERVGRPPGHAGERIPRASAAHGFGSVRVKGKMPIGASNKEVDVKPTGKGVVKVKVTITPPNGKAEVKEYEFEVK